MKKQHFLFFIVSLFYSSNIFAQEVKSKEVKPQEVKTPEVKPQEIKPQEVKPKEIKKVLTQERKKSDEAKIEARIFEDQLVDRKITENNLQINAFLDVDRKDTDSKLLDERNDNDLKTNQHILSYDKISNDLSTRDQYLATVSHDLKNPLNAFTFPNG